MARAIMSRTRTIIRFALILLIVHSASGTAWKPNNSPSKKKSTCGSTECAQRGKEYADNMNNNIHPCQDFFSFTCGNWQKNHPGPKYASEWSLVDVINSAFAKVLKETLESFHGVPRDDKLAQQAKDVYDTCVKIPEFPIKEAKAVADEIKRIGRYPNVPLWELHTKYLQVSGESAFFSAKILGSKPSEGTPVLMLMEPASAYGAIYHDAPWNNPEKKAYLDFLFKIVKSLNFADSDAVIKERIEKVFEFRTSLEEIVYDNADKRPGRFDPYTQNQLTNWFSEHYSSMTDTQKLPWDDVVELFLKNLPAQMRQTRRVVALRQNEYFLDLLDFLKDVPKEVLANHMEMYFIERHVKWQPNMFALLEATTDASHRGRFSDIRERYFPRWQLCIENHNMQEVLERMLFDKWQPMAQQSIINQMIVNVKAAIELQMKDSPWLDQKTRVDVMKRLNGLEQWIGFPTWYTKREIPRRRDKKGEILTPNASLNIVKNLLYIHAPLMFPPIFNTKMPAVYNYAGLGTTLGHELYHMVHNCGSYPDGNARDNVWWSFRMRNLCLPKLNEFIMAYNKVTDTEFQNRYGLIVKSNTGITNAENLPDVMGLEAAYNAYRVLASKDPSICQTLPGFKDYSCDQMFYIAFGNTFCGYYTKETARSKLDYAVHSIDSVRINGAVAQMDSFATAFGCPAGTPMNPRKKVNLWH